MIATGQSAKGSTRGKMLSALRALSDMAPVPVTWQRRVIFARVNGDCLLVEVRFTPKALKPAPAALSLAGRV
jgi:hypothetical protein